MPIPFPLLIRRILLPDRREIRYSFAVSKVYMVKRPRSVEGVAEMARGDVESGSGGHPQHWHSEWQLVAVTKGDGWVRVAGTKHRTPGGSLFLIPPEAVHSNDVLDDGCQFRSMLLDHNLVEEVLSAHGLQMRRQQLCGQPVWQTPTPRFEALHHGLEHGQSNLQLEGELVNWLTTFVMKATRQSESQPRAVAHPAARRAKECIWSRAEESLSLTELATEVGLSRFELTRQFKHAFGMPPHAWQLQVRVERSKALLKEGVSAGETALRLGFADQAHFSRVFRKATGYTPARFGAEFRKIVQDDSRTP